MTRMHCVIAALLLAACCVSATGGRHMLQNAQVAASPDGGLAGAPGPSQAGEPLADILFTLTAARAELSADTLKLTSVAPVALHTTADHNAGATPIADFANATAGGMYVNSAGQWLADPVAVLSGTGSNGTEKALVKLSNPSLSDDKSVLTFQVTILPANSGESLPTAGGVTARLVDDKQNGLATGLVMSAPAAPLTDAALFIDVNSQALGQGAKTEFLGCLLFGCGGGWGWGGGGYGYGGGWDRGYDGWHGGWGHHGWGK